MNQNFDIFNLPEYPLITLVNPNRDNLAMLSGFCYDLRYKKRFNALSEVTFTFPSSIDNGETMIEAYDLIQAKRQILFTNEGYFVIDKVNEETDGTFPIKKVECKSLESEMIHKRLTIFNGTYKFYNLIPVQNQKTLMDAMLEYLPNWSIGSIDLTVAAKFRTFDITDSTIYSFLMNDVEKAYGCIFSFDTQNRKINVKSIESAVIETDIFLSYDNLIKNSDFTEITDEIATCLYVYGSGDLSINFVNPLGTNRIYNFTYYKNSNWMSSGLIAAITAWEDAIELEQPAYAALLTDFRVKNTELIDLETDLETLQTEYTAKET